MNNKYEEGYVKEKQKDPNDLSTHLPKWLEILAELYISPLKYQIKREMKTRDKMKSYYEEKKYYYQDYIN